MNDLYYLLQLINFVYQSKYGNNRNMQLPTECDIIPTFSSEDQSRDSRPSDCFEL